MPHFLGIDTSTTATKALILDDLGRQVAVAAAEYPLSTPRPLWAEQDPELWWKAAQGAIRQALADSGLQAADIRAIGLTGQMHGLVLLDGEGRVLRPAILWNDQRSAAECEEIRRRIGLEGLVRATGNDAFAGFTAPKILWVRKHEPELYARIRQVLLPKDYLRYRLTGTYATDKAGAGGTLLLDLATRDWSTPVLEALQITADWLPPTHEGTEVTGTLHAEAARVTGLAAGTPVVAGGGDQAAQAVGVGAVEPGVVALTLGTSGVIFASTAEPLVEARGRLHAFPHALPGRWHVMGVMLSAAGSLRWYRDAVAPEESFENLLAAAGKVEHERLVELGGELFRKLPAASADGASAQSGCYAQGDLRKERDLEQVHLILGLPGISYHDDDFYALQILSATLGGGMSSRLFQEVREKRGLAYSVFSFAACYRDTGVFGIYAGTGEEQTAELVPVLCDELTSLIESASEEEIARARAQLKASMMMGLESCFAQSEDIARQLLIFGRRIPQEETIAEIDAVDAKAIKRVGERLIEGARPSLAAVGPVGKLPGLDDVARRLAA